MIRSLIAQFRLRILFRCAFLLLTVVTVSMALYVLREEKQQALDNYQDGFRKTADQIEARLRHPTGQLALLNPHGGGEQVTPLRPLLLPFSALDFDDPGKVQSAVEMAGCMVRYPDDAAVCVAIGANAWAGGFIYVAGRFASAELVPHLRGERTLDGAHRLRVQVSLRGQTYRWMAPFETADTGRGANSGRLTGFVENPSGDYTRARPVRDFRGWLWQGRRCASGTDNADCLRESFYSIRLPVEVLRDALFQKQRPVWPPADLDSIFVQLQVLPPGSDVPIFDSNNPEAKPPFLLSELQSLLLPGESLRIRKLKAAKDLLHMVGPEASVDDTWPVVNWLIRRLPVDDHGFSMEAREAIRTPVGTYELILNGNVSSANRILANAATRVSWFVAAMLLAILATWLFIEFSVIHRIAVLTRRAASVNRIVKATGEADPLDLSDLRGPDELGILASCLHDLLRRVREDVEREKIRAEQEKDMWHAVGHEIMSPLQSLMALHGDEANPSHRYIHRMQQAVRVLYGQASPSEAFQSSSLQLDALDLNAFLRDVASNAACVGVADVQCHASESALMVRADEYSLEDVVTHILKNADRYRELGSTITISVTASDSAAQVSIHNRGPQIAPDMLDKIFEYGVSDQTDSAAHGNRGQGLFVAKTYMAKMSGTIGARNTSDGVEFVLSLPRAT